MSYTHTPKMHCSVDILNTSFKATYIILMFRFPFFNFIFSNTKERKRLEYCTQALSEDGRKSVSRLVWPSVLPESVFQEGMCPYGMCVGCICALFMAVTCLRVPHM